MKETTKTVTVYMVGDKEFLDKTTAEKYESEISKELDYTYFTIKHNPDLTEGRGYYKVSTIAVPKNYAENATAQQYCFNTFGKPLEFVMGVSPIPNWEIIKQDKFKTVEELHKFKSDSVIEGLGTTAKLVDRVIVYLDTKGNVDETK